MMIYSVTWLWIGLYTQELPILLIRFHDSWFELHLIFVPVKRIAFIRFKRVREDDNVNGLHWHWFRFPWQFKSSSHRHAANIELHLHSMYWISNRFFPVICPKKHYKTIAIHLHGISTNHADESSWWWIITRNDYFSSVIELKALVDRFTVIRGVITHFRWE